MHFKNKTEPRNKFCNQEWHTKSFRVGLKLKKNVELGPEESIDELVKSIKARKELEDADKPEDEEETKNIF